jgi:DNA-binding NarL/FixJ family response regulator
VIQVAIVDGCRVFAQALAARLGEEPDIRVLRCATGPAALQHALSRSSADVVLADAALFDPERQDAEPGTADAPGRGRAPGPGQLRTGSSSALVLLADTADLPRVGAAVRSGIRGWVPREGTLAELLRALRAAADGGTWLPPKVLTAVLDELTWRPPDDDPTRALLDRLTLRERDVLDCLADGLGRPEVGARLHVSTNTVRTHVQSILSKLGVNSSVAAVALLRRAVAIDRSPRLVP